MGRLCIAEVNSSFELQVILKKSINKGSRTWPPVSLLHPDVAVVLSHARLRVQERHSDAALGTQAGVVAATVLDGLLVELIAETEEETEDGVNLESNQKRVSRSKTTLRASVNADQFQKTHANAIRHARRVTFLVPFGRNKLSHRIGEVEIWSPTHQGGTENRSILPTGTSKYENPK